MHTISTLQGSLTEKQKKGLRVDFTLTLPSTETRWVDVGGIHTEALSYATGQQRWLENELNSECLQRAEGTPNPYARSNSAAVQQRVTDKCLKYNPLVQKARVQKEARKRKFAPDFRAAIISNDGEMSDHTFEVIEWMTAAVKQRAKLYPADNGVNPSKEAALFRTSLKDELALAAAIGMGKMMRAAGYALAGNIPTTPDNPLLNTMMRHPQALHVNTTTTFNNRAGCVNSQLITAP